MPTKIVKEIIDKEKLLSGDEVTPKQLADLSQNLFDRLQIYDDSEGDYRSMDCINRSSPRDTKTAYFDWSRLDDLRKANSQSKGLLIIFGVHNSKMYPLPERQKTMYENKLMVVLATSDDGKTSNTNIGDEVYIAGADGGGVDNGKLCPPNTSC